MEEEANTDVDSINKYVSEIRTLNDEISVQTSMFSANALLDQRDKLVIELGKIANINVAYDSDNMANISVEEFMPLTVIIMRNLK